MIQRDCKTCQSVREFSGCKLLHEDKELWEFIDKSLCLFWFNGGLTIAISVNDSNSCRKCRIICHLHFLHSVSAAMSLSTRVTSLNLFLCVSLMSSGSPPLSVLKWSKSSTIFPRCPSRESWARKRRRRLQPGLPDFRCNITYSQKHIYGELAHNVFYITYKC